MGCYACTDLSKAEGESNIESNPAVVTTVSMQIREYPVLVYSTSDDADCNRLKDLLKEFAIKFEYFEVDRMSDPEEFRTCLTETTGRTALPVIFVGGNLVGGLKELREELDSGKLHERLKQLNSLVRPGRSRRK